MNRCLLADRGAARGTRPAGSASGAGSPRGAGRLGDGVATVATDWLTKRCLERSIVESVSFRCKPGTVTAILGPDGAGKTTTLRLICGLTAPSAGRATVLGAPYRALPNPARRVGVLLDATSLHVGRRGHEVLALAAQTIGVDQRRVDALFERVGLDAEAARTCVRDYPPGMRQRLGIAHALLGDPEVLILDEPTNGLDPQGVRWLRELLREFAAGGGTVLLSSRNLPEIEEVADRLVIIRDGRVAAQGARDALLGGRNSRTLARADDDAALQRALATARLAARPAPGRGMIVDAEPRAVARAALEGHVLLHHLAPASGTDLEQLLLDLTPKRSGCLPRGG